MGTILTEELASQGMKMVLASTNPKKLNLMKEKYESEGASITVSTVDVTNEEEVKTLFHLAQQTYGQADILVNLAGLPSPMRIMNLPKSM
ncbi:hypothetical protein BK126_17735 [Paenibacillus sp. FSL H7-0326]|uniref:SDR family NAD(P)-dependent oxidoreductase n=1 Tax=Paenibacillus sp. FSL H7-0326 TaxID=1921144 RepID=UPI00096C243C|nr:SDR family NAD(P)-dependent oxidoreductase [Paenibacillus sp. FSL H7-0326]OMC67431.1 hypothetical protein BK126_17735 [Paenibacillus sp. FSL H7-0326]